MDDNEQQLQHGDSIEVPSMVDLAFQNFRSTIEQLRREVNDIRQRHNNAQIQIAELKTKIHDLTMMIHKHKILSMDSQIALSDKYTMPKLEAILNCGYRLIDTAWIYQNEHEIGNGIHKAIEQSQGQIKREDLFITTKLWNQHHPSEEVEWALRDSLKKLRLDYVDLYLIHWPVAFKNMPENIWSQNEDEKTRYFAENVTLCDTWKAMENLVDLKLTRSIGISNFNESEIEEILKIARIKPTVHQIELHPYCNQHNMRQYCIKHNISIISYCPLSNLKRENEHDEDVSALYNPIIQEIAKSKHKTTAQIILRWHLQNGLE
ncbi:unnamed protein product, partial [Rotaria sp. Silwood2]